MNLHKTGLTVAIALVFTQFTPCNAEVTAAEAKAAKEAATIAANETADGKMKGLGFGVGVGAVFDVGGSKRVKNASVDPAGVIRVQSDDSVRVGALLETHYLWGWDSKTKVNPDRKFYHGFQASALVGENVIDGIGLGYMMALRRLNSDSSTYALKSFNLGAGAMIQPSVQTLGKGLVENAPLPAGDQIRYKNEPKPGVYVVFSVGF